MGELYLIGSLIALVIAILWILLPFAVFSIKSDVQTLRQHSVDVARLLKGTDRSAGLIPQLVQMNQQLAEIKALLQARQPPP